MKRAAKALALLLAGALSCVGGMALRVQSVADTEAPQRADAIVMLGARVLGNGAPSNALRLRAERAAALYRQGRAPLVLFSGGSVGALPSEASLGRTIALEHGVPADACVLEELSHSTLDNAELSRPLLQARGAKSVLIVSDGYHLLRASALFRRAGFTTFAVASGRELPPLERSYQTLREVAALARRPWLLF